MSEAVYVSTEAELEQSLAGDHKVTVIKSDYVPAIFNGYNINYCFNEKHPVTDISPTNFRCLWHVFHPFNHYVPINEIKYPYRGLLDKVEQGHNVHFELSITNVRLLRLCQCFMGLVRLNNVVCQYRRCRNIKGNLPIPYIIGKCKISDKHYPAWSYYWDISDKKFWIDVETDLRNAISQFNGKFISDDDANKVWELFNTFAKDVFYSEKDIAIKRLEGPDYLIPSKLNELIVALPKKLNLFKYQPGGDSLCDTVIEAFRTFFYSPTYANAVDPFDVPYTGYSQMPEVANTDLAMPTEDAVDCRKGIVKELAEQLNSPISMNSSTNSYHNPIIYSITSKPLFANYKVDQFGNIIAFKLKIGSGTVIIYPEGREDIATELIGTTDADKSHEVMVVNGPASAMLPVKQLDLNIIHNAKTGKFTINAGAEEATALEVIKFGVIYAASVDPVTHFVFADKVNAAIRNDSAPTFNSIDLKCIYKSKNNGYNSSIRTEVNKLIDKFLPKNDANNYIDIKFKFYNATNREVRFKNILLKLGNADTINAIEKELNKRSAPQPLQDFILKAIK